MKRLNREVPKRRRREKKTDYNQRLKLLKSKGPRIVIRKTNNNTIAQITTWSEEGDNTILQAEAQELDEMGWNGHMGNLPSAYLTGYLIGKRAQEEGIDKCILDMGLQENTKGNRVYAAIKGARDGGLEIPVGEEMMPSEERIQGKHIEEYASEMNSKEKKKHFSSLMEKDLDPEKISENFEKVKDNIEGE